MQKSKKEDEVTRSREILVLINLDKSIELFEQQRSYTNDASRYLPIGPQPANEQDLSWPLVFKTIYEILLGLKCDVKDLSELYAGLVKDISSQRETRELKVLVEDVYLNESSLRAISPYLNLICDEKPKARTKTMVSVFRSLLKNFEPLDIDFPGTNFIEGMINTSLKSQCKVVSQNIDDISYLPFLSELIKKDLRTISSNAKWLADDLRLFVELYSFIYLTQLSLQIGLTNERFERPVAREVYFILETETASKERHDCNIKGYERIFSKLNGYALDLFPHLGYLELLSDLPVWMLSNQDLSQEDIQRINKLNELICSYFDIPYSGHQHTAEEAINYGLHYHKELFKKSSHTSSRSGANEKVFDVFKDVFSKSFKADRKAAGWYFQLNTRTLLLLTNLVIGSNEKLLLADVIDGFKLRGVYLDLKSRSALLKLYENIGNIEKLSDSGDAVYVKRTI